MTADHSDAILERLFRFHPKLIDLHLDRVWRLLDALGNPERSLPPVIHIAGTNGKGSTTAMIDTMAGAAGLKTLRYISPHLVRFHERIAFDRVPISESDLAAILERCEQANGEEAITYFEITTVAAIEAFRRFGSAADLCLLEVGLGGRLDATNVIDKPAACVITPVSLDHQHFLGDTIEAIAGEKAGIIKPGVPVVVAEMDDRALAVIHAEAEKLNAPLLQAGQDFMAYEEAGRMIFQDDQGLMDLPLPALPGTHQIGNAGCAIAALRAGGFVLGDDQIASGLESTVWPARFQKLTKGPLIDALPAGSDLWLDGGHNPAAGQVLADHLKRIGQNDPRPLHLIVGMMAAKDAKGFLEPLVPLADHITAIPVPGEDNAADPKDITDRTAASAADAIRAADLSAPARVLICGSLYLAGQILRDNG